MAYSSPATVSDGNVAPATWGNSVKTALDYLANPPSCKAHRTVNQLIPNNTITALVMDAEDWDTNVMHDNVTLSSRITFKTAGLYVITGNICFAPSATGFREVILLYNGGGRLADVNVGANAADSTFINISTQFKAAVNDYVEIMANQTSGGALNVLAAFPCFLAATWVGLG